MGYPTEKQREILDRINAAIEGRGPLPYSYYDVYPETGVLHGITWDEEWLTLDCDNKISGRALSRAKWEVDEKPYVGVSIDSWGYVHIGAPYSFKVDMRIPT